MFKKISLQVKFVFGLDSLNLKSFLIGINFVNERSNDVNVLKSLNKFSSFSFKLFSFFQIPDLLSKEQLCNKIKNK